MFVICLYSMGAFVLLICNRKTSVLNLRKEELWHVPWQEILGTMVVTQRRDTRQKKSNSRVGSSSTEQKMIFFQFQRSQHFVRFDWNHSFFLLLWSFFYIEGGRWTVLYWGSPLLNTLSFTSFLHNIFFSFTHDHFLPFPGNHELYAFRTPFFSCS